MLNLPSIASLAIALVTANAQPELVCGQRSDLLAALADQYHEEPVGIGLASNGGLIELLTDEAGKTWTLIITAPNGSSCVLAEGQDWQHQPMRARLDRPGV
jgi:hypothetical protein